MWSVHTNCWLRPIATSPSSPPLQAGAQTLLGRETWPLEITPGGFKSTDFLAPQCGSASTSPSPSHRRTAPHRTAPSARRRVRVAGQPAILASYSTVVAPMLLLHLICCGHSCLTKFCFTESDAVSGRIKRQTQRAVADCVSGWKASAP